MLLLLSLPSRLPKRLIDLPVIYKKLNVGTLSLIAGQHFLSLARTEVIQPAPCHHWLALFFYSANYWLFSSNHIYWTVSVKDWARCWKLRVEKRQIRLWEASEHKREIFQKECPRRVSTKSWEERLQLIEISNYLHLCLNCRCLQQLVRKLSCKVCRTFSFSSLAHKYLLNKWLYPFPVIDIHNSLLMHKLLNSLLSS